MQKRGAWFSVLVLVLGACGGSKEPAATGGEHHEHGKEHGKEHGEHGEHHKEESKLPPAVREFHQVLAPLWHAEKGPDRVASTCAKAPTLKEKATATGDAALIAATTELVAECAKDGRPQFDARFTAVHEKFHALAER